jgi:hypothetical protein
MAVLEPVTDPDDIRRHLERLGLSCEPAVFAPARDPDDEPASHPTVRPGRGPPCPVSSAGDPTPPADDPPDPPWQDDGQIPLYDDDSQVPPDAQD